MKIRNVGSAVLQITALVVVIYAAIFLAFYIVPLEPVRAVLGPLATPDAVAAYRRELGLDRALPERFLSFLVRAAQLDFGRSFYYARDAATLVLEGAPESLSRAALGVGFGGSTGVAAAYIGARWRVRMVEPVFLLLQSAPVFCWLLVGLWIASRLLATTPLSSPPTYEVIAVLSGMLVPLGAIGVFTFSRLTFSDGRPLYVTFMEMLGAPESAILRAVLFHNLPAVLAIAVNSFPAALAASAFAELLFNLPGLGGLLIRACERGDLPVIHAATTVLVVTYVVLHKAAEAITARYDVRYV